MRHLRIYTVSKFIPPAHKQQRLAFMWESKRLHYRTMPLGPVRKVPR